jgi:dolichol-phosphate mannosyltransferase
MQSQRSPSSCSRSAILSALRFVFTKTKVGDFRLIDKKIYNYLIKFSEQNPFIRGLIPWTGFKQVPVNYHRNDRHAGKSGYSFFKMLNLTLDGLLGFSNLPIKLAYVTSIFSILLLIALIFYALISYFKGGAVPGWTSLIVIILFFNSLNFFILALLGEYIGRIFNETKKRPRYIVSEVLEN